MPPPGAPKTKKTASKTVDPEPMKGLTPAKTGYVTPKKDDEEYSPAKEVDLGEELTENQKGEIAEIGSRQEAFNKAIASAKGGKSRRKHKKSKKTRKVKKHGKRRA